MFSGWGTEAEGLRCSLQCGPLHGAPSLHPCGGLYKSTYGVGNRRAILGCLDSHVVWQGPQDLSFHGRAAEQYALPCCLPAALWPSCYPAGVWTCSAGSAPVALNPVARQESLASVFGTSFQLPFRPNTHKLIRGCSPRLVTRSGARTSVTGTVSGDALEEGMAGLHNSSLQEAGLHLKYWLWIACGFI